MPYWTVFHYTPESSCYPSSNFADGVEPDVVFDVAWKSSGTGVGDGTKITPITHGVFQQVTMSWTKAVDNKVHRQSSNTG